jgi:hypothetical protein
MTLHQISLAVVKQVAVQNFVPGMSRSFFTLGKIGTNSNFTNHGYDAL